MRHRRTAAAAIAAASFLAACIARASVLELHVSAALTNAQERRFEAGPTQTPGAPPSSLDASRQSKHHGPMALRDALTILAGDKARAGPDIDGVDIALEAGIYRLASPLQIALGANWRGTPITLRGPRDARAVISGAQVLRGFAPVRNRDTLARLPAPARGRVLVADLAGSGIPIPAPFEPAGFGMPVRPIALELFYDDRPLVLARWPKRGFATISSVPDGRNGTRFTLEGADAAKWRAEPDLRAMGYWARDWADETLAVRDIDPVSGVLTLQTAPRFGIKAGQRVAIENALSALDEQGEYYLDRRAGKVYVWPPGPLADGDVEASVVDTLLRLVNVTDMNVRDMTFDMSRGDAVAIQGGSHLSFERVTILNAGARALVSTAKDSRFTELSVKRAGQGGVAIYAGDRNRLSPGNAIVADSTFEDYARLVRTYRPAISLSGVGNSVVRNIIHDGPHAAIIFGGNDHLIAGNDIYDVATETRDTGAIYTGRDWTARGTIIENNFLHDIGSPDQPQATMGIYLDDQASGITIRRNVFSHVNQAVFIGGGRDNVVENNVFANCSPAVHVDSRGMSWQHGMVEDPRGVLRAELAARHVDTPPYATRYPALGPLVSDRSGAPKGTVITRNVLIGAGSFAIDSDARPYVTIEQTFGAADARFVQPMADSTRTSLAALRLAPDSPALTRGFMPPASIAPRAPEKPALSGSAQ